LLKCSAPLNGAALPNGTTIALQDGTALLIECGMPDWPYACLSQIPGPRMRLRRVGMAWPFFSLLKISMSAIFSRLPYAQALTY
jgi:hypothetical protein